MMIGRILCSKSTLVCAVSLFLSFVMGCGEDKPIPAPAPCTAGTLDCDCDEDGACEDGLACQEGTCVEEEPDCTLGEIGCACDGGQCAQGAVCNAQDLCEADEPPDCVDGDEGCACIAPDNTCDGSLTCVDGRCIATLEMGLGVGPDVRACDLLLESAVPIVSVEFDASVVGRHRASGAKMAISFTAKDDTTLSAPPLQFGFASQDNMNTDEISIVKADCFDSTGNKIQDNGLTLAP